MQNTYLQKKNKLESTVQSAPKEVKSTTPALPNSLLLAMHGGSSGNKGNPELENIMKSRLAAFHRQIPVAENEADKLSSGITSGTPEQVKQSMGERLGTDFSSVRFHTGESISQKADNIGARAWTQGNDVYFGEGGFHPAVAAHELVHTAQQGAVDSSAVNVSAPMGGVQMWGLGLGKWFRRHFCCGSSALQVMPGSNAPEQRKNRLLEEEPKRETTDKTQDELYQKIVMPQVGYPEVSRETSITTDRSLVNKGSRKSSGQSLDSGKRMANNKRGDDLCVVAERDQEESPVREKEPNDQEERKLDSGSQSNSTILGNYDMDEQHFDVRPLGFETLPTIMELRKKFEAEPPNNLQEFNDFRDKLYKSKCKWDECYEKSYGKREALQRKSEVDDLWREMDRHAIATMFGRRV